MQEFEHKQSQETSANIPVIKGQNGNGSVYDYGVKELHQVTGDESTTRRIENEFREVRGREATRTHLTLKALSETDRRAGENTRATLESIQRLAQEVGTKSQELRQLIERFEAAAGQRFDGVHEDLRTRSDALSSQVRDLARNEEEHYAAMKEQVSQFQQAMWKQADANHGSLQSQIETNHDQITAQVRQTTERLAFDVRQSRDELVSLVDNRMNQSDASFAALRGDIEVVKFLVMDLIKDRIGRHDPKNKGY